MSDLLHAVLKDLQKAMNKGEITPEWTITDPPDRDVEDGYIFLRKDRIIVGCIIDIAVHKRAQSIGKGPITVEQLDKEWVVLCDADTPEQAVSAFINFATFGAFNATKRTAL